MGRTGDKGARRDEKSNESERGQTERSGKQKLAQAEESREQLYISLDRIKRTMEGHPRVLRELAALERDVTELFRVSGMGERKAATRDTAEEKEISANKVREEASVAANKRELDQSDLGEKEVVIEQEELDYIERLGQYYREHPENFQKINGYVVSTLEPNTGATRDVGSSMEVKLGSAQVRTESDGLPTWAIHDTHTEVQGATKYEGYRREFSAVSNKLMTEGCLHIREGLAALGKSVEALLQIGHTAEQMITEWGAEKEDVVDGDRDKRRFELKQAEPQARCRRVEATEGAFAKKPRHSTTSNPSKLSVKEPRAEKDRAQEGALPIRCTAGLSTKEVAADRGKAPVTQTLPCNAVDLAKWLESVEGKKSKRLKKWRKTKREYLRQLDLMDEGEPPDSPPSEPA